jgi:hypothetical protein
MLKSGIEIFGIPEFKETGVSVYLYRLAASGDKGTKSGNSLFCAMPFVNSNNNVRHIKCVLRHFA